MAQPTSYLFKYTGAFKVTAGTKYLGSSFSTENVMQMKTDGVMASVNGSPMFQVNFNDISVIDAASNYVFSKDCIIATGEIIEVTL